MTGTAELAEQITLNLTDRSGHAGIAVFLLVKNRGKPVDILRLPYF